MLILQVQKDTVMRTIDENYVLLEQLVNEEKIYLDPAFPYVRVCRLLGVGTREMDAVLERELGLCGDELFAALRGGFAAGLERKYGIKCFFQEV